MLQLDSLDDDTEDRTFQPLIVVNAFIFYRSKINQ